MYWLCSCECGNQKEVARSALASGGTSSCGCFRRERASKRGATRLKNEKGNRYGRLVVLRATPSTKHGQRVWLCQCDCGNTCEVVGNCLRRGSTQSCGCLAKELTATRNRDLFSLPPGRAALNDLYARYKRQARKRGIDFGLPKDLFRQLIEQNCHYCGAPPSQTVQRRYGMNGCVFYNGVDRRDNTLGYTSGNVVPCCGQCNRAKSDLTESEFIAWAQRVVAHPKN